MFDLTHQPLQLAADEMPAVRMLEPMPEEDAQADQKASQRRAEEEQIRNMFDKPDETERTRAAITVLFTAAHWTFAPEGTVTFAPEQRVPWDEGQRPMSGTYRTSDGLIALRAEQRTDDGALTAIDGVLRPDADRVRLDAVYSDYSGSRSGVATISQRLAPVPPETGTEPALVAGIPVPSTYAIVLNGTIDGRNFGPVAATLELGPAKAPASVQLAFLLSSGPDSPSGSLSWAFSGRTNAETRAEIADGTVTLGYDSNTKAPPTAPWWYAADDKHPVLPNEPLPYKVTKGRLAFTVHGTEISGTIEASGVSVLLKRPGTYAARFTGHRQEAAVQPSLATPDQPLKPVSFATVIERNVPFFDLTLEGSTEAGPFGPLPGTLNLLGSNPDTFSLFLATAGELGNGGLVINLEGLPSTASLHGADLHLEMAADRPPAATLLNWYTLSREPHLAGMAISVIPQTIRLVLHLHPDLSITGEIQGEGHAIADQPTPSRYTARLTGTLQGAAVERQRQDFGRTELDGLWRTGGNAFGQMTLTQEHGRLTGTFTGRGGGTVQGHAAGGHAGFAWRNAAGQAGWGVIRVLPGNIGAALLWGQDTERGAAKAVRIVRTNSTLSDLTRFTEKDLLELRYFGGELIEQGRFEEARQALNQAFKLYSEHLQHTRFNSPGSDLAQSNLISQESIISDLVTCDFRLNDYNELVKHMQAAVKIQKQLTATQYSKVEHWRRIYAVNAETIHTQISFTLASVGTLLENVRAFEAQVREPQLAAAVVAFAADLRVVQDNLARELQAFDTPSEAVTNSRQGLEAPWKGLRALKTLLKDSRTWIEPAVNRLLVHGNDIYRAKGQGQLLEERDVLIKAVRSQLERALDGLKREVVQEAPVTRTLLDQEQRLLAGIRNNAVLNPAEKTFFEEQMNAAARLSGLADLLRALEPRIAQLTSELYVAPDTLGALLRLSRQLDRWRVRLIRDQDKIEALDTVLPVFQGLVSVLLDLSAQQAQLALDWKTAAQERAQASSEPGTLAQDQASVAPEELFLDARAEAEAASKLAMDAKQLALAISELARSRAFVDLVAQQPEIARARADPARAKTLADMAQHGTLPNFGYVAPLQPDELRAVVRDRHATAIEYFFLEEELAIWVIRSDCPIEVIRHPLNRAALDRSIERLHTLVEASKLSAEDRGELTTLMRTLHAELIAPIPRTLLPPSPDTTVILVPDRELSLLPFAAMQDEAGSRLVERHPLVYAPSLSLLKLTGQNRYRSEQEALPLELLALVNPQPLPRHDFHALPTTEQWFPRLAQFYADGPGRKVLTGPDATIAALKAVAAQAAVLFFATHAEAPDETPMESSFIALAEDSGTSGFLRIPDIFGLPLRSEMVILGACKTGGGRISGDGVIGISRAFIAAGAPTLLMTLWTTAELQSLQQMYRFHEYWKRKGLSKVQGIRLAQLDALRRYPDQPNLWANFVLYGEPE